MESTYYKSKNFFINIKSEKKVEMGTKQSVVYKTLIKLGECYTKCLTLRCSLENFSLTSRLVKLVYIVYNFLVLTSVEL